MDPRYHFQSMVPCALASPFEERMTRERLTIEKNLRKEALLIMEELKRNKQWKKADPIERGLILKSAGPLYCKFLTRQFMVEGIDIVEGTVLTIDTIHDNNNNKNYTSACLDSPNNNNNNDDNDDSGDEEEEPANLGTIAGTNMSTIPINTTIEFMDETQQEEYDSSESITSKNRLTITSNVASGLSSGLTSGSGSGSRSRQKSGSKHTASRLDSQVIDLEDLEDNLRNTDSDPENLMNPKVAKKRRPRITKVVPVDDLEEPDTDPHQQFSSPIKTTTVVQSPIPSGSNSFSFSDVQTIFAILAFQQRRGPKETFVGIGRLAFLDLTFSVIWEIAGIGDAMPSDDKLVNKFSNLVYVDESDLHNISEAVITAMDQELQKSGVVNLLRVPANTTIKPSDEHYAQFQTALTELHEQGRLLTVFKPAIDLYEASIANNIANRNVKKIKPTTVKVRPPVESQLMFPADQPLPPALPVVKGSGRTPKSKSGSGSKTGSGSRTESGSSSVPDQETNSVPKSGSGNQGLSGSKRNNAIALSDSSQPAPVKKQKTADSLSKTRRDKPSPVDRVVLVINHSTGKIVLSQQFKNRNELQRAILEEEIRFPLEYEFKLPLDFALITFLDDSLEEHATRITADHQVSGDFIDTQVKAQVETATDELTSRLTEEIKTELKQSYVNSKAAQWRQAAVKQLKTEIEVELRTQIEMETRPQIEMEIRAQIVSELRPQIMQDLRTQIETELDYLRPAIQAENFALAQEDLWTQFSAGVNNQMFDQIREKLEDEVKDSVYSRLEQSFHDEMEAALRVQIKQEVKAELRPQLTAELTTNLKIQIRADLVRELEEPITNGCTKAICPKCLVIFDKIGDDVEENDDDEEDEDNKDSDRDGDDSTHHNRHQTTSTAPSTSNTSPGNSNSGGPSSSTPHQHQLQHQHKPLLSNPCTQIPDQTQILSNLQISVPKLSPDQTQIQNNNLLQIHLPIRTVEEAGSPHTPTNSELMNELTEEVVAQIILNLGHKAQQVPRDYLYPTILPVANKSPRYMPTPYAVISAAPFYQTNCFPSVPLSV
jgi:hypothetical protein